MVKILDLLLAFVGVELDLSGDQRDVDTLIEFRKADVQKAMCCL